MERVISNYDFTVLEHTLFNLDAEHSSSTMNKIRDELNNFFIKSKCKGVYFTRNTDKLFFGMRVYPIIDGNKALELVTSDSTPAVFDGYYLEIDSKLCDPMLYITPKEMVALILHEVGHIVYDTSTIDEVKNHIDSYFARSGEHIDLKSSRGFRELLAWAIKDACFKAASLFAKHGNTEMIADAFVTGCGYGPELESAMRKIIGGISYMRKDIDDRYIALSWVLRVGREFELFRVPAVKTLNRAAKLTGSVLERKDIELAAKAAAAMSNPVSEGVFENIHTSWNNAMTRFKQKSIRGVKQDVYELQLRIRTAEDISELMSIIRSCNNYISILQDYMTEDISDAERQDCSAVLQDLYAIRQEASQDKQVRARYSGYIQVVYPSAD